MLRYCSFITLLLGLLSLTSTAGYAASPDDCSRHSVVQRIGPCEVGKPSQRTDYPLELMMCFDYKKLSGATGNTRFFALDHFDPSNLATIPQQLADHGNQVFGEIYVTGPVDYWCRGKQRFNGVKWIVMCDDHGGIGWITGESLEYARQHTWPPGRRPIVMGRGFVLTDLR